jgi:hypothetical protein
MSLMVVCTAETIQNHSPAHFIESRRGLELLDGECSAQRRGCLLRYLPRRSQPFCLDWVSPKGKSGRERKDELMCWPLLAYQQ